LKILILTDFSRGSYKIIGDLFAKNLSKFGTVTHLPTPQTEKSRNAINNDFPRSLVLHNTLGEGFVPLLDCYNIALPFHEWSKYPANWIGLLNKFDEAWVTTDHLQHILLQSGLNVPAYKISPPLDFVNIPVKSSYETTVQPRFLFVGEPHFRKGHHLLMNGYMKAFPVEHDAKLTIKTSPNCEWESPRADIELIKEDWNRDRLVEEYIRHDCFVSASLGEGLGLPIAEAIIAQLPVCANYWGGHQSMLTKKSFVEITHREIIQPFTSDPKYYAENQKCAYSSPNAIKQALLEFLTLNSNQKQSMTKTAKEKFLGRFGSSVANTHIRNRLVEIQKKITNEALSR
jgi:glycosyltransferase involved in cell wall biosynthesis